MRRAVAIAAALGLLLAAAQAAPRQLTVVKAGEGTGTVTSTPAGIKCGSTCSFSFLEGTTVKLTGAPGGPGVEAVKWSGCDSVTPEGECKVTMSAAKTVTATFNIAGPALSVSKLGSGTGTVTSSPAGIACGAVCALNFAKNSSVTLTGTAGFHSEAAKWAGCNSVSKDDKCLVSMTEAKQVTATFDLEPQYVPYMITVDALGTGRGTVTSAPSGIECGATCSAGYIRGTPLASAPRSPSRRPSAPTTPTRPC